MPKGKDIYFDFSKKWIKRRRAQAGKLPKGEVPIVDNYKLSVPTFANSRNQHPDKKTKPRLISPNEGKPAVNSSAKTNQLIHRPRAPKIPDPTSGAIKPEDLGQKTPKTRGRPSKKEITTDAKSKISKPSTRKNKKDIPKTTIPTQSVDNNS